MSSVLCLALMMPALSSQVLALDRLVLPLAPPQVLWRAVWLAVWLVAQVRT
jgi:hypothetical protein